MLFCVQVVRAYPVSVVSRVGVWLPRVCHYGVGSTIGAYTPLRTHYNAVRRNSGLGTRLRRFNALHARIAGALEPRAIITYTRQDRITPRGR